MYEAHYLSTKVYEHWHRAEATFAVSVIKHILFQDGRLHRVEACSREQIS